MARQIASVLAIVFPAAVSACMGIGDAPVRFTGQRNVVVWDRMRGMEYFVRDAQFETRGKSLGFIAPTPTSPSIKSVGPSVFTRFERLVAGRGTAGGGGLGGGLGGGVAVVRQQTVAGYEATTLRASDPHALVDWLTGNGYSVPRYATRWSEPYVRRGWYFTAFKVSAENGAGATGPVCMTFTTNTPYNPYSVPAENTGRGGLSLYYVSNGGEEPMIGGSRPWLSPQWSKALSDDDVKGLETDLGAAAGILPKGSTVKMYRDENFGRPGVDDLYFMPVAKVVPAHPSSNTSLLAGLGLCALACVRAGRKPSRIGR